MQVHLTAEQESRIAELAARDGRSADELVQEAITRYFEDDERFVTAVMKGLASLDCGVYVTQEEVAKRIDRLFQG